uniref:Uncharacterized protein n=1 Tax=Panagrolaimus sp. ES5 TaxID=591445 RepID=A0AC34FQJ6_9BILA
MENITEKEAEIVEKQSKKLNSDKNLNEIHVNSIDASSQLDQHNTDLSSHNDMYISSAPDSSSPGQYFEQQATSSTTCLKKKKQFEKKNVGTMQKKNTTKDSEHQINNDAENANVKISEEKAFRDVEKLERELTKLHEFMGNRINLINYFNDIKQSQNSSASTINELRESVLIKEEAINGLQQLLKAVYESEANLKDEKSEAESKKLIVQKECEEFREALKTEKEKFKKLEKQFEEVQEKLTQKQDKIDQENETLKTKFAELHESTKRKNDKIAELQLAQHLDNQIIQNSKVEIIKLEQKLIKADEEHINLMEKHNNLKTVKEQEKATASKLSDEMQKHERTTELLETAMAFNDTAYASNQQEAFRATEAESKYLQCQNELNKEIESCRKLAQNFENIKKRLAYEIIEKEKAVSKLDELERHMYADRARLLEDEQIRWEKKLKEMEIRSKNERETLTAKSEKLEVELAASKKSWEENVIELQTFVQKLAAFEKNKF